MLLAIALLVRREGFAAAVEASVKAGYAKLDAQQKAQQ